MKLFSPRWQHLYDVERKRIPPTPLDDARLHRLERPEPWPAHLYEMFGQLVYDSQFQWYPDYQAFLDKLTQWAGHPINTRVILGAGIEDFIRSLFILNCAEPGVRVAYPFPTCAMFDVYAKVFQAVPHHLAFSPGHTPSVEALTDGLPSDLRLLILPNPGQPVETFFNGNDIGYLANWCAERGCVLALDEAYFGFGATSMILMTGTFPNLLVMRTFSKVAGGAGLRLAYAVGQESVIQPLDAIRESGEVAGPSMALGGWLIDNWHEVEAWADQVKAGRNWLRTFLKGLGYKAYGQYANHVLVELPGMTPRTANRASQIGQHLWDRGFRTKFGFPSPAANHILVTCGSLELMHEFADAFQEATLMVP